jgi:hypothetical protein
MTDNRAALAREFDPKTEVRQFTGRGGQTFDYIEDETVMDRLDEVLGVGEWSITVEPISLADGVVKVTLRALGQTFEDFGYASNAGPNAEGLKEAVSDGIRRCGRFLGIGRYLYRKHAPLNGSQPVRNAPGRPQPVPVASRPTVVPDDPYGDLSDLPFEVPGEAPASDDSTCAEHGIAWIGSFGDRYHKKPEGGYCRSAAGNVAKPRR